MWTPTGCAEIFMPITLICPGCEKKLKVADTAAGKTVRCPSCSVKIAVPEQEEFVEPDEPAEAEKETGIASEPAVPKKTAAWDKDSEQADADKDTGITSEPAAAKKKAAWDKDSPETDEDADGYGMDEEDAAERRRRTRKNKRRREEDEEDDFGDMRGRRRGEPHRGILILVLGIVALSGACLCACIGWGLGAAVVSMANTDLAKMDNGVMDREGRSLTTAGKACAIIGVGIGLINAILGVAINVAKIK